MVGSMRGARRIGVVATAIVLRALAVAAVAQAQTFTVANLENSGAGSLRAAVSSANGEPGADTIVFAPRVTGAIELLSTGLVITEAVDIEGPQPSAGIVAVRQTDPARRVFEVKVIGDEPVKIADLRLEDGTAPNSGEFPEIGGDVVNEGASLTLETDVIAGGEADEGGGIAGMRGDLAVIDSTIGGNGATNIGGIWINSSNGSWRIVDSTILGNTAADASGGIEASASAGETGVIEGSTISGNSAATSAGAELEANEGKIVVRNTTIVDNHASETTGGLVAGTNGPASSLTVESTTIAANAAMEGSAGVAVFGSTVAPIFSNSILAGNLAGGHESDLECEFCRVATEFDLIGRHSIHEFLELVPGSNLFAVDPRLEPLADNGGPTATMALAPTSPAIDTGSSPLTVDQRGAPRPVLYPGASTSTAPGADAADIGAYELQPPAAEAVTPPRSSSPPAPVGPAPTARPPLRGIMSIGKVKLHRGAGTASVFLAISGPGVAKLIGSRSVRAMTQTISSAKQPNVELVVKAKGAAARKLRQTGRAKVKLTFVFTATGAAPVTRTKTLVLHRR
jgi:hypothetical protein